MGTLFKICIIIFNKNLNINIPENVVAQVTDNHLFGTRKAQAVQK
jgi:hypothetical protein